MTKEILKKQIIRAISGLLQGIVSDELSFRKLLKLKLELQQLESELKECEK